jgi:hypothetical protein
MSDAVMTAEEAQDLKTLRCRVNDAMTPPG